MMELYITEQERRDLGNILYEILEDIPYRFYREEIELLTKLYSQIVWDVEVRERWNDRDD